VASWAGQRRARFSGWCPGRCGGPQRSRPGRAPAGRAPPGTCPGLLPDRPGWPRTRLGSLATSSPTSIRGASTPRHPHPGHRIPALLRARARLHRPRLAGARWLGPGHWDPGHLLLALLTRTTASPRGRWSDSGSTVRRCASGSGSSTAEESQQAGAPLHPHPPQDVIPRPRPRQRHTAMTTSVPVISCSPCSARTTRPRPRYWPGLAGNPRYAARLPRCWMSPGRNDQGDREGSRPDPHRDRTRPAKSPVLGYQGWCFCCSWSACWERRARV
jgi:hypothetical protein